MNEEDEVADEVTDVGAAQRPASELGYAEASRELDEIVAFFEQRDVDIDQLVARLERATAIVDELDRRLRRTRLQVEELVPRLTAVVTAGDEAAFEGRTEDVDATEDATDDVLVEEVAIEMETAGAFDDDDDGGGDGGGDFDDDGFEETTDGSDGTDGSLF